MKLIPLGLAAVLGLAASTAHAHNMTWRGWVNFGPRGCAPAPVYCPPPPVYCPPPAVCAPVPVDCAPPVYCPPAPVYCPPVPDSCPPAPVYSPAPTGYWRNESCNVWVPERWVASYDAFGCARSYRVPGHYETRTRQVWVNTCG